ncbi:MAG: FeoB-associated Cys-rich membrane protein [Desulfuromonadaceae bacterium]
MGACDIILVTLILGGAFWLLYHSLWKKKGCCQGCDSVTCNKK